MNNADKKQEGNKSIVLSDLRLIDQEGEKQSIFDWRHAYNVSGFIPAKYYADQPYLVKANDGAWVCTITTNPGEEGDLGQCVVSMRSTDMGKNWSDPVTLEENDGRENSYSVLLKVPYGRIYCFYNHNTDNIRRVKADNPPYQDGYCYRVDSLGYFVFKYSDDNGKTWSKQRYPIPVREFQIDRDNADKGQIRYFWNVGKPFIHQDAAYVSLHKVGGFGYGFFTSSEGVLLKSSNIITERDPNKIQWETLPEGDIGLRTPPGGGPISEEQSYCVLSDGSFYAVYRSVDGHPVESYSRNCGRSWSIPKYKCYSDGRPMKHPRAACFVWRCNNGKYLFWFHNHGGKCYDDRNPVWVSAGEEFDGVNGREIQWSQPEILLYEDDTYVRMSYPDMIEEGDRLFITETNKNKGRVHEIDREFLKKLWSQFSISHVEQDGLLIQAGNLVEGCPAIISMPVLPYFNERNLHKPDYGQKDLRNGFTLELWLSLPELKKGTVLLDNRTNNGQGLCLEIEDDGTVGIILNDGRTENRWYCEPGILKPRKLHHIGIVVDGGPKIISFIIDGKFCDGGDYRQFGWGRFSSDLRHVNGEDILRVAKKDEAEIRILRIYGRALMTTELIGNYRAGLK
jgi:hypothetical protein